MELNIGQLSKNFKSTGAKDHPFFWINGAENIIPNLIECIDIIGYEPLVKNVNEFSNPKENEIKELFQKYGSDKFIHGYYKYYSNVLSNKTDLDILEIGIGTKDPTIPSTMFFYKEDKNFESTPGSSLRGFRDFVKGSSIYGADIDKAILFEEDGIKTEFVDQLDRKSIDSLFIDTQNDFDFIIIDGLHHITADMNSILSLIKRLKDNSTLVVEDIVIFENWKVVDFIISRIDGYSTYFIKDEDDGNYMYSITKN
jgi:hypothetical protein